MTKEEFNYIHDLLTDSKSKLIELMGKYPDDIEFVIYFSEDKFREFQNSSEDLMLNYFVYLNEDGVPQNFLDCKVYPVSTKNHPDVKVVWSQ